MLSTRYPHKNKGHIQTESERLEKDFPCKQRSKKTGVAIFISDKIGFKTKAVKRDKEGHYIIINGSIQEDITIINVSVPNIGVPQYIKQMLTDMKGEINSNTIILGTFNTCLHQWTDHAERKVIKKHKP